MANDFKSHLCGLVDHSDDFLQKRFDKLVESSLQISKQFCETSARTGRVKISVDMIPVKIPPDIDHDLFWSSVAEQLGIAFHSKTIESYAGWERYPYDCVLRFLVWGDDPIEEAPPKRQERFSFFRRILCWLRIVRKSVDDPEFR